MKPTIHWENGRVIMIDQRKLPAEEVYVECTDHVQVAEAIEEMVIRGAPAIGVAAAYGVALGIQKVNDPDRLTGALKTVSARLGRTRPTARNLFWALERMKEVFENNRDKDLRDLKKSLIDEARKIESEDLDANKRIGAWGKELIRDGDSVLTHCNAGGLATAGYGTALGVIRAAFEQGKKLTVFVDETRPFLQGARLTIWELIRDKIPSVLITDNMAGYLMQRGEITSVITGADRITGNGDTANKIGTYSVAVLARENSLPFYVAAPMNTIDFGLGEGAEIPIEERDPREVREAGGCLVTLPDVAVRNPAFDVTPACYITAIVTDRGIARPPYEESLEKLSKD